jgi:hypothetical protein
VIVAGMLQCEDEAFRLFVFHLVDLTHSGLSVGQSENFNFAFSVRISSCQKTATVHTPVHESMQLLACIAAAISTSYSPSDRPHEFLLSAKRSLMAGHTHPHDKVSY